MKTHFPHTLISALTKVAARLSNAPRLDPSSSSAPDHVMRRLESVFESLSDLSFQPNVAAAFELACDALQAELPTAAVAAGVYDINSDEIRIVAARGLECDLLRGVAMSRERCFAGRGAEHAFVIGGASDAGWLGTGETDAAVLLCPILSDANLLGVLALAEPLCAVEFDAHDLELATYVADQLARFIQARRVTPSLAAPAPARLD